MVTLIRRRIPMSRNEESAIASSAVMLDRKQEGLLQLAARCETATGPDRELDLQIMQGISGRDWFWHRSFPPQTVATCDKYGEGAVGNPACSIERFTASIDDALTL